MSQRRLLAIVNRPIHLVNRQEEMQNIFNAIFGEGDGCRIVLVEGAGGLGKTRLIEEVLRRLGHPETQSLYGQPRPENDWGAENSKVIISDLIDFTDIRLHTREFFLEKLADPLNWGGKIRFTRYAQAHARYQRLADFGVAFTMLEPAAVETEKAFWADYQQAAQTQRLIIPLDTAEQLAIISSKWLLDRNLIQPEDTAFNTQQWLLEQISQNRFTNTTLLIAGREEEGVLFFDLLKKATKKISSQCELISINLNPFGEKETRAYFNNIYEDWTLSEENQKDKETANHIRKVLDLLRADDDRLKVLWRLTGGQPIRLALYLDILVEGKNIPDSLLAPWDEVQSLADDETKLTQVQKDIEGEFIQLLFSAEQNLRARILRSLARATRGLSALQIHYILDSEPDQNLHTWQPNQRRLDEIKDELKAISRLSIVKNKPNERIGLQDEMYRIYAESMSANEENRQKEILARQAAYKQMRAWAEFNRDEIDQEDEVYIREDLKRIRVERPSNILSTRMPVTSAIEERRRNRAATALLEAELEFLHYTLVQNPNVHFNDVYYNMANERTTSYKEAQTAIFQAEMWRILHDQNTFRFIDIPDRPRHGGRSEPLPDILRRAAQTDDAVKWLIRFYLRKEYDRAIILANAIEVEAEKLINENEYHSWNHTFARHERTIWREYARLLKGEAIQTSIDRLEPIINDLEVLNNADIHTLVFPERNEYGFIGHPAQKRLQLILAIALSFLAYGYVTLGDFNKSVKAYANSLKYLRHLPKNQSRAMEGIIRNNLSRVLVEMGKKRSIRVCEDGLELRIQVGDWLPIALSYNTLGLIMNDLYRPIEATEYCARALAIASSVGDSRVIGLVLIQLGEALRRLVQFKIPPQDPPEEIYREAERALEQARDIFNKMDESVRLIEAYIETGCLYRDWLLITDKEQLLKIWERRFGEAVDYLSQAIQEAHGRQLARLELDARVNLGLVYFYANDWSLANETLKLAEQIVPEEARLHPNEPLPKHTEFPSYFYKQLSKIYGLRGNMALKQFADVNEKGKKRPFTVADNKSFVQQKETLLIDAATAYTQALGYAELYSPRSDALTIMYDVLYAYLKRMNSWELSIFFGAEKEASQQYGIRNIKLDNFGNLEGFLLDNFGDYYEPVIIS